MEILSLLKNIGAGIEIYDLGQNIESHYQILRVEWSDNNKKIKNIPAFTSR